MKRQQAERPACTSVHPLSFHSIKAVASRETRRLDQRQLLESRQVYQSAQTSTVQRPFVAISSWQFPNRDSSAIALHCTAVALRHCLHCPSRTPTAIGLHSTVQLWPATVTAYSQGGPGQVSHASAARCKPTRRPEPSTQPFTVTVARIVSPTLPLNFRHTAPTTPQLSAAGEATDGRLPSSSFSPSAEMGGSVTPDDKTDAACAPESARGQNPLRRNAENRNV